MMMTLIGGTAGGERERGMKTKLTRLRGSGVGIRVWKRKKGKQTDAGKAYAVSPQPVNKPVGGQIRLRFCLKKEKSSPRGNVSELGRHEEGGPMKGQYEFLFLGL